MLTAFLTKTPRSTDLLQIATVLYLQGNGKDAESLIKDSIRIFEDGEQGESFLCMRRLRYLVQNPDYCCLIFFLTSLPPPYRRLSNMASSTPKILLAYIVVASQIPNRPSSFLSSLTGTASTSLPPLRQLIHSTASFAVFPTPSIETSYYHIFLSMHIY
ncbi:hypothetical protein Tco_1487824 [Tanacetum coccineum]